jgi:phosphoribosylaminoimidazolecarboxamide formyltransferase/IMP cyclohydrolase
MINVKTLPPPADLQRVQTALISCFDKTGLGEFGQRLAALGIHLVSTGGTARALRDAGLEVTDVSEITGFPEMLDGRVKTLHPHVHAGVLARKNDPDDLAQLEARGLRTIDMVVVNLYPFEQVVTKADVSDAEAAENIDIGGPTMIRAAAKNFFSTAVVASPGDYGAVADELERNGGAISLDTRRRLALQAFRTTAAYDAAISSYLEADSGLSDRFMLSLPKAQGLRYGENPHQSAAFFGDPDPYFHQLHGKELSYNNLLDLTAAIALIDEFSADDPTVAILKHTNPCGIAVAGTLHEAWERAFATDTMSPFGGIVAVNRPLDIATAEAIDKIFTEVIIAPSFDDEVLELLTKKKNRRLIRRTGEMSPAGFEVRSALGGVLVQERDPLLEIGGEPPASYSVATTRPPTAREWADLLFAWRVAKHVKSNAIVYARERATLGVGAGQMSRIDASEIAIAKGAKSDLDFADCVVASDAFFPFADGLLAAAEAGATAAIQPGGSVRDDEVIEAANDKDMAMVFTGRRHFRH